MTKWFRLTQRRCWSGMGRPIFATRLMTAVVRFSIAYRRGRPRLKRWTHDVGTALMQVQQAGRIPPIFSATLTGSALRQYLPHRIQAWVNLPRRVNCDRSCRWKNAQAIFRIPRNGGAQYVLAGALARTINRLQLGCTRATLSQPALKRHGRPHSRLLPLYRRTRAKRCGWIWMAQRALMWPSSTLSRYAARLAKCRLRRGDMAPPKL